jgi:hypothetical protein
MQDSVAPHDHGLTNPTPGRRRRLALGAVTLAASLTLGWVGYKLEPHLFNMDDGPYGATEFAGETDHLPLLSRVELRRFGWLAWTLESRRLGEAEGPSVLVLKSPDGAVRWRRQPLKPDGPVALDPHRTAMTWNGGWRVGVKPAAQESGELYLNPLGEFRFFYHSW